MPYSSNIFNIAVANVLAQLRPATIVDIGAGAGKYGTLARQVASLCGLQIRTTAIEIDQQYVEEFQLAAHYDEVVIGDALEFQKLGAHLKGDVCILGDFIEHLPKSCGMDLLHFLLYRFRYVIVAIPVDMYQDEWMGHAQEAHVSLWYERDFAAFENASVVRQMEDGGAYLLACLNGVCVPMKDRFEILEERGKLYMGHPYRAFVECAS